MVGLVLLLRDKLLPEVLSDALKRVSSSDLPVLCLGGYSDAGRVIDAVRSLYTPEGVLILIDSDNFTHSIQEAIEKLEKECSKVRLCPAPLFEGAIAAAKSIVSGADIEQVYFEALKSISPKLRTVKYDEGGVSFFAPEGTIASYRFVMSNLKGLTPDHVQSFHDSIAHLDAKVSIANLTKRKAPVNARSSNRLALVDIEHGDEIELVARGNDATHVIDVIKKLAETVFNTDVSQEKVHPTTISVGLCSGYLFRADGIAHDIQPVCVLDTETEIRRFHTAIEETKNALLRSKESLIEHGLKEEAQIFDAQIMLLEDTDVIEAVCRQVQEQRMNAAYVYQEKMLSLVDAFRNISDVYVRERATDLMDISSQVLMSLTGMNRVDLDELDSVIIAAHEVTPSLIGRCKPGQLKGILTNMGSPFSHVAILARALGIPAVAGYRLPAHASTGDHVIIDTLAADVSFNPDVAACKQFEKRYKKWQSQVLKNLEDGKGEAISTDGCAVPVYGNVGDVATAEAVLKNGAEGIGLLRTEFLYMNSRTMPSEKEQVQVLKDIFKLFATKPIYVRTLDIGGDKYIPWLPLKKENNPFMGVRGVRLYLKEHALFRTQIRSILLAGRGCNLKIMIPMISVVDEVLFARQVLDKVHQELEQQGLHHAWPVEVGTMVETPSAVLMADELAKVSDFFSIGTNDLLQYMMAAERGERELKYLLDPMQPALLKAIQMTIEAAKRHNIRVSVCGEIASDPAMAKILLGLGVHCLSMNAASIGQIKRSVRTSNMANLQARAMKALKKSSVGSLF